jgi:hypothetical protein
MEDLAMLEKTSSRGLVLAAACVMGLTAYAVRAEDNDEKAPIPPANAVEVDAGELADKPASYLGLRVKVRAEIEDVHTPHVFTLDEDKVGASPDVLVLAPGASFPKGGDVVEVTGTVRAYVRTEIERDYDWFDLEEKYDVTYSERPVIVAESVRQVEED